MRCAATIASGGLELVSGGQTFDDLVESGGAQYVFGSGSATRTVVSGETVSLGAVELVVAVSDCSNPSVTGAQPGTRPCICCVGEVCTMPTP